MNYAAPTDLHEPLRLRVSGLPYRQTADFEHLREVTLGSRSLRARGLYYIAPLAPGAGGGREITVAPIPAGGEPILLTFVFLPALLSSGTDLPPVPVAFHRAIVDYARAVAYGAREDNAELDTYYRTQFSDAVAALRALRQAREQAPSDALLAGGGQ